MFVIFHSDSCEDVAGIIIGVENTLAYAYGTMTINFHCAQCPFLFTYFTCMPFPNTWNPSIHISLQNTRGKSLLIDWVQLLDDWRIALSSDNCLWLHMQKMLKGCWRYWRLWRIHRESWMRRTSSTALRFLATSSAPARSWRLHRPQRSYTHTTTSYKSTSTLCLSHSGRRMLRKSKYNLKCTQQCSLIISIISSWHANILNAWIIAVNMHVPREHGNANIMNDIIRLLPCLGMKM